MRLLLINSIGKNKWGGGEKWMITTAQGLIQRGHQVYIGCHHQSIIEAKAAESSIPVIHIPIKSDFSLKGAYHLWKFTKEFSPEVIIGCQNRDIRIAGFLKPHINKPLIISRQGVKLISKKWKYKWSFQLFCDGIITNTQTIKKEYDSYRWWDQEYVKVIYNGIDNTSKIIEPFNFKQYCQGIENPQIVVSAGRLTHQKGFEYLIETASKVCNERNDIFFFIAGKGRLQNKLIKLIKHNNLTTRVFIIGFQDDLSSLLMQSDLFILSSLYEGMPNVIMEAMLHKVPVISTDVNGVSELIDNNISGYIVPPADSNKMASKIIDFFNDDSSDLITEKAYERITTEFTIEAMLDRIESYLYEKLETRQ